ncbi:permease [Modestobacter sp. VKM Ac-2986]|uniref:permease n=1 Tax=Modestobacter sp. VKM Ac-2986 TaxID=3004140 RepID=UPI0022AB79BD|nr:permease [Modestobacter sp. VKM Ac-2986]MCZ2829205.1 permease [Modestobacter sp. VKM Ac-2986]
MITDPGEGHIAGQLLEPEVTRPRGGVRSTDVLAGVVALAVALHFLAPGFLDAPVVLAWSTVFIAVCLQAFPFLVLGVALSAAISTLMPPSFFARVLPRRPAVAVPVAGLAGVVLPGCECASVPVAGSLVRRGVAPAAALAFLLAAPAVNPVVLVATAVAFPGQPAMVAARFVASLLVAVLMGWLWTLLGRSDWLRLPAPAHQDPAATRAGAFGEAMRHDLVHAGGFLVVGGATAATLGVLVPRRWLEEVAGSPVLAVLVLALLAVVLAVCSEADAFVAAGLTSFSLTARLVFLVVGPAVDVKLIALQAGTFGRRFAVRFAPLTFLVAVAVASAVGGVLL